MAPENGGGGRGPQNFDFEELNIPDWMKRRGAGGGSPKHVHLYCTSDRCGSRLVVCFLHRSQ